MSKEALLRACEAVGGQTALAKALGLKSQGSVADWIAAERPPAERVLAIEAVSGVSRHDLRPDLYPRETSTPSTVASRGHSRARRRA